MRRKAILIILFLVFALKVKAVESDLVVTEIMYDAAGADGGQEWVEIYNSGPEDLIVSSTWRFFDGANHGLNLEQATTTIVSQDFFILADNKEQFLLNHPDFSGLVVDTVMSLSNSSSTIGLSFDSGQTYQVEVSYDSVWGGADGFSLQLFDDVWQESCQLGGTPGSVNEECQLEDPPEEEEIILPDYSQIIISEFLPNPAGSDDNEWIELYNQGSEVMDLTDFKLGDNSSRRFALLPDDGFNINLAPNNYLLLSKSVTGISLNNSGGEAVKLYNPSGDLQQSVEYSDSALEDRSYALSDNGFVWTKLPTPGAANQFLFNQPPVAQITLEPGEFIVGTKLTFSAHNSSDPEDEDLDYSWDFGDGQTSSKETIKHKFEQLGSYTVQLEVGDSEGLSDKAELVVIISSPEEEEDEEEQVDEIVGEEKLVEPVIDFSEDDLIISEFIPNPKGSDDNEWIELYNNSSKEIDLKGWYLDDAESGSKPYYFSSSTPVMSGDFLLVKRTDSKITLNNSSDSVRLLTPREELWQEISYEKIPEAKSYAWDLENSEWFIAEPSPGEVNLKIIEPEIVYEVSEIKDLEKKQNISLQGVALNSVDSETRSLYLLDVENFEALVEIYSHYKNFPDVKAGDLVNVVGEISRIDDLPRVKIKNTEQVCLAPEKFVVPKPESIAAEDVDEDFLGSFVTVKGVVVKKSGKSIYLASELEEEYNVRVYTKFSTKELEIKKGSELIASGILSETDSGFKLSPLAIEDILVSQEVLGEKIVEQDLEIKEISTSSQQIINDNRSQGVKKILMFIFGGALIVGSIYLIKKRLIDKNS